MSRAKKKRIRAMRKKSCRRRIVRILALSRLDAAYMARHQAINQLAYNIAVAMVQQGDLE